MNSNAWILLSVFLTSDWFSVALGSEFKDNLGHSYSIADRGSSNNRRLTEGVGLPPEASIAISENSKILAIPDHIAVQRKLRQDDLYNLKAEAFYNQGLRARSIEIWEKILRKTPNHVASMNNLAMAYFNERRYKDAETLYKRLIELDGESWNFPEARFFAPLAYYQQYGDLDDTRALYLADFLNSNPTNYRARAEKLRLIAINRVSSNSIDGEQVRSLRDKLAGSERSIVHFWAEWCRPCLGELKELFAFRSRYPDYHYLIVSIDSRRDKDRSDRRLNDIFSPFKSDRNDKIDFLLDDQKLLWKTFIPSADQQVKTVPRTVFVRGANPVGYYPQQLDWKSLDPATLWNANNELRQAGENYE